MSFLHPFINFKHENLMFKKHTYIPPWCKIQNNYFSYKALWILYFAKVKTKHQSNIYFEGARPVSSLAAFTQKDQTLFKIASFFTVCTQNLRPLGVGGHEIYNLWPPFLLMLRTTFGEEWYSSSWEEVENTQLLTHDGRRNARWTTTDAYP